MRRGEKVRVILTVADLRANHGGTSRSIPALCDVLAEQHIDVHLIAGRPIDTSLLCTSTTDGMRLHFVPESHRIRRWGVAAGFRRQLNKLCSGTSPHLLHDNGIWLSTNHAVASYARNAGIVRVASPRGMLSTWSMNYGWWKKRMAWWAYQRRDLALATAFHATANEEAVEIRSLGFTQPIAVIPNGVCFPQCMSRRKLPDGKRIMLFLSRVHPKKGLLNLVRAWKIVAPDNSWTLVIAGPDEGGHGTEIHREIRRLQMQDQISLPGEISDADKWTWFAASDVFVLPSFSENFGIVVAEALAAGTPVITTTGTPWAKVREIGCGWQVEPTIDALCEAIQHAVRLSHDDLGAMGQKGSAWIREQFTWSDAGCKMIAFYRWLLDGGSPPQFVAH
jgi:glycosyltransferase involved in cell wall biosynthesis